MLKTTFTSKRNPEYEGMSYGDQKRIQREKNRAKLELAKALVRAGKELEHEKPPKEDPVPLSVRTGAAEAYGCICGKSFYATAILPKCPFCGVAGRITALGRLLGRHQDSKFKNHEPRI